MYQPVGSLVDTAFLPSRGVGRVPVSYRQPIHWPIYGWRAVVKRTMDISIALILLVAFSVILLVIMLLIRLKHLGGHFFASGGSASPMAGSECGSSGRCMSTRRDKADWCKQPVTTRASRR
jgi:hypothetical protein